MRIHPLSGGQSPNNDGAGPACSSTQPSSTFPWGATGLFRTANYLGTELLRRSDDESREYLTLDRWASRATYEAFRAHRSGEYRRLDRLLEELTEEETLLG